MWVTARALSISEAELSAKQCSSATQGQFQTAAMSAPCRPSAPVAKGQGWTGPHAGGRVATYSNNLTRRCAT